MHILIIEDEPETRAELKSYLENSLYQVTAFSDFEDGGKVAADALRLAPDLVLLDLNLPGQSGFEICAQIRASSDMPIIFVTGRDDAMDEVNGLLTGGDDYITKPFYPPVLLAHIAAVLKRADHRDGSTVMVQVHQGVELDMAKGCARYAGRSVELTKNELKILNCLFQKKGAIVPRLELIEFLWDNQVFIDDNSLSVNVARISSKLAEIGVKDFIKTKRGMGYYI